MSRQRLLLKRCGYGSAVMVLVFFAYLLLRAPNTEDPLLPDVVEVSQPVLVEPAALSAIKPAEVVPAAAQVIEHQEFVEPLQELSLTEEQSRALYEAEEKAVARCMNERGFEYIENTYLSNEELDPWGAEVARGDVEVASELGYGISTSLDSDELPLSPDANHDLYSNLDETTQAAWDEAFGGKVPDLNNPAKDSTGVYVDVPGFGVIAWDTESCLAAARRAVYGDDVGQVQREVLEMQLLEKVDALIEEDESYQSALQDWRDCMAGAGLTYRYPGEPGDGLRQQFQQGAIDRAALVEREIQLATQDAQCFQTAGLAAARLEAERRADAAVREKYGEDIEGLALSQSAAIQRAEQLLSGSMN